MNAGRCKSLLATLLTGAAAYLCGCRSTPGALTARALRSPVSEVSLVPQVTALAGAKMLVSWQSPLDSGGYSFSMAVGDGDQWSEPRTIASGPDLSLFSADLPGVATLPGGALMAFWELKDARDDDPYATAIQISVSTDEGRTWGPASRPYGDALAGQHSFLSWFPANEGIGLVWLDACERSLARHAAMSHGSKEHETDMGSIGLRHAALSRGGRLMSETFITPITCECCPTSAAVSARGPVVVYRGRQEPPGTKPSHVRCDRPTVRDIYITRLEGERWTEPHLVHADNWVIAACPDNGPAVDASEGAVAVAWWTRAGGAPQVHAAFSNDSGDSFGPAIRVDSGKGEGQVTIALLPGGEKAVVGWLEGGQTWARVVSTSGAVGPALALGPSPLHSRLPKWTADDQRVVAVWTAKLTDHPHVQVSQLSLAPARP